MFLSLNLTRLSGIHSECVSLSASQESRNYDLDH